MVWELVKSKASDGDKKATLLKLDDWLGLDIEQWAPAELVVPEAVEALVAARQQARTDRDFSAADALRGEIEALGFSVEDTREGPKIAALSS